MGNLLVVFRGTCIDFLVWEMFFEVGGGVEMNLCFESCTEQLELKLVCALNRVRNVWFLWDCYKDLLSREN